jgi:hypothetical protein
MEWSHVIHGFGLFASALVVLSFTMRNIKSLRLINLTAALLLVIYGYLIKAYPIIVLNLFSGGINVYYLWRLRLVSRMPDIFDVMFVDPGEDDYVRRFILFYEEDIHRFFPSFDPDPVTGTLVESECCFILRETMPVSLVVFRKEMGDEIAILLDYAVPAYRDMKNAKFFFETVAARIASPGTFFSAVGEVPAHTKYLRRLNFEKVGSRSDGAVLFQKKV